MAAAAHVTVNVYGRVFGQAPYQGTNSDNAFTRLVPFDSPSVMSIPTTNVMFHPVSPGQRVGLTSNYIYSVIELLNDGLRPQPQNTKYGCGESVATLAGLAG